MPPINAESISPVYKRIARWAKRCADKFRDWFDWASDKLAPSVVAMLALAVILAVPNIVGGIAGSPVGGTPELQAQCSVSRLPINPLRLQATFSAARFTSLVRAEDKCIKAAKSQFTRDTPFAIVYGVLLPFIFIWIERWRRFKRKDEIESNNSEGPVCARNDYLIVAPLIAAVFDIIENITLAIAVGQVDGGASASMLFVAIGSICASLKWTILLVFTWGATAEFMSGPRGTIARLLRYSVIGAIISSVPLAVIDQGQEILQRVAESDRYIVAPLLSVGGLLFVALAVWYLGRVLLYLNFDRLCQESHNEARESEGRHDVENIKATQQKINEYKDDPAIPVEENVNKRALLLQQLQEERDTLARKEQVRESWLKFFAEYLPRLVGIATLFIGAIAFAKLALEIAWFVIAAAVGALVVILTEWRVGKKKKLVRDYDGVTWRLAAAAVAATVPTTIVSLVASPEDYVLRRLLNTSMCTLASAWIFYAFVEFRYKLPIKGLRDRKTPYSSSRTNWNVPAGFGVAASAVLMFAFAIYPVEAGRGLGSMMLLAIAAINAVFFGTMFLQKSLRYKIPIVRLGLVAAILFSIWNDNHRTAELWGDKQTPERERDLAAISSRPTLTSAFTKWATADTAVVADSTNPIIIVATAGGGLRAAYWTAAVLAALQDANPKFADHVFAISSVSGGSLGAALFVGLVKDKVSQSKSALCALRDKRIYTSCVHQYMNDDHLSPLLSKLLAPDFAQRFIPIAVTQFDRSTGLEDSWADSYHSVTDSDTFRNGMMALNPDSLTTRLPLLLLNTTHVESGRRYITAPVKFSGQIRDADDVLTDLQADLKLAAAVHNSARFPFVSPPGRLGETDTKGRLVDGGYFENSGLVTAQEVYSAIRTAPERRSRPIWVVYLCNDPIQCAHDTEQKDSASVVQPTWGNEIAAPVRAILSVRDGRASLARAQLAESIMSGDKLLQLNVCDNQTFRSPSDTSRDSVNIEVKERARKRVVSPPLGWMLSKLAIAWMDESLSFLPDTAKNTDCRTNNSHNMNLLVDPTKTKKDSLHIH